jgi:hypothetical protein
MEEGTEAGEPDGSSADAALGRRLKALACTAPVHDLDARKGRLDWVDAGVYQMSEIALTIIDQVTIRMDLDRGADHDEVVRQTKPLYRISRFGRALPAASTRSAP